MPIKRSESSVLSPPRSPKPIAVSKERRALIDNQVSQLSATARKVAAELPFAADVSDYLRVLDEAGRS
jgi:hypothetical protein